MKKFMHILSLPAIVLVLAACNNNNTANETTTSAPEITTAAPETTTEAQVITPTDETTETNTNENEDAESSESTDADTDSSSSEVEANDVPFKVYVNGELKHEFVAKDAVGGSVLDAMQSIDALDFYFDEEEGFITSIDNIENDYSVAETWVYLLNGQYAEYGVVSQTLSEGDEIEWYYGTVDELPVNIIPATE